MSLGLQIYRHFQQYPTYKCHIPHFTSLVSKHFSIHPLGIMYLICRGRGGNQQLYPNFMSIPGLIPQQRTCHFLTFSQLILNMMMRKKNVLMRKRREIKSPMVLTWKRPESVMTPPNGKKVAETVKNVQQLFNHYMWPCKLLIAVKYTLNNSIAPYL